MPRDAHRSYVSPRRAAAADATHAAILEAAKAEFENRGWAGTTLASIAAAAGVSPKTVQARFGTKPKLLAATVNHAIRGDSAGQSAGRSGGRRPSAREVEAAPDAAAALARHAAMATAINLRAAGLAGVVEAAAAAGDPAVQALWSRMQDNMRFGVAWAARLFLAKPGVRSDLTPDEAETIVQVAMAWGTHRTLAVERSLAPDQIERWVLDYYRRMFMLRPAA